MSICTERRETESALGISNNRQCQKCKTDQTLIRHKLNSSRYSITLVPPPPLNYDFGSPLFTFDSPQTYTGERFHLAHSHSVLLFAIQGLHQ